MISILKRNKVLSFLILFTFIIIIVGLLIPSILPEEEKNSIQDNLIHLQESIHNNQLKVGKIDNLLVDAFYVLITWSLGISIIGIPIILSIYLIKVLIFSIETVFFILNISKISLSTILIYILPNFINIFIYFFLLYYAVYYSIYLIQFLFLKKDINFKLITRRYIKILLFCLVISLIISLFDIYFLPKILTFFS